MELIIKIKFFNFISIFLLFNSFSTIICLIEIPIKLINSNIIPKYEGNLMINEIPPYLQNIIRNHNINKNYSTPKMLKIFSESGDIDIIPSYLLTIQVKLGSPNQEFSLILDTGSTITWVPIVNSNDSYPIKNHYNPSNSLTSKKLNARFKIKYGTGSCNGNYYKDKMIYINNKQFDLSFGAAESTDFRVNGADGIIGLSKIYDDEHTSFIHMLCRNGVTKSKIFSFKLGLNLTYGKFYIGMHDDFKKDNAVTCEIKNSNYFEKNLWACEMTSFSIINYNKTIKLTSNQKISVIFDSGTNIILLPLYYLKQISEDLAKINCYPIRDYDLGLEIRYQLLCLDEVPDFNFIIGGHTFILPGKYFFNIRKNFSLSKILFQNSIDFQEVFIIGSPFFMLFHILFDSYSKELHFYPEKDEFLIKGSWWNSYHIILVVIFIIFIISFILLITLFIFWKKKNKIISDNKELFDINSHFGLL